MRDFSIHFFYITNFTVLTCMDLPKKNPKNWRLLMQRNSGNNEQEYEFEQEFAWFFVANIGDGTDQLPA